VRTFTLITAALVAALSSVGCDSGQRETCRMCGGDGRSASGSACTFCTGRGYRELSKSEVDRRRHAEENLRRKSGGDEALSNTGWWWETTGKGLAGFLAFGLVMYLLSGQYRRGGSAPSGSSAPDPPSGSTPNPYL
jgi:hypothetical protein